MAAAVEGNLTPWERRAVLRHLAACQQCTAEFAALHSMLREVNLLPPIPLRHPLEEALSWLRRIAPLPTWLWHSILFFMTPPAWTLLVNVPAVSHMDIPRTWALWPVSLIVTIHFLFRLQADLRQLMVSLWQLGIPREEINDFQYRYLAIFQGRGVGGGWFFLILAFLLTVANWILLPAAPFWEGVKIFTTGFYPLVAVAATHWGWFWGGRLLWALAHLWKQHPTLKEQPVTSEVQRLALWWVIIAGGSMLWQLILYIQDPGIRLVIQVWGTVMFLVLLALWAGYARLEWTLGQRPRKLRTIWQPVLRLAVTLALVVLILPIIGA